MIEIFDPETATCTDYGNMNSLRQGHYTLPLHGGRILVVGGVVRAVGRLGILANISEVNAPVATELYDPATDEWTKLNDTREGHGGGLAIVLNDGRALVAGGHNQGQALASAEVFDPKAGAWTRTKTMARRTFANRATVLPDGSVMFIGGFGLSKSVGIPPVPRSSTQREWTRGADTVHGRLGPTLTQLSDGRIVTIGGSTASGLAKSAEYFDPNAGEWYEVAPMGRKRSSHTATLLKKRHDSRCRGHW